MIKILTALLLMVGTASASDCRLINKDLNTAIICAYPAEDNSGLQLLMSAFEKNKSPITSISLVSGKKVLNICYSEFCQYFWPKSNMVAIDDYTVTAIAQNGARIIVNGKLDRP